MQVAHRTQPRPLGSTIVARDHFATTLHDGRRVIGHGRDSHWQVHVYSDERRSRLLGYGRARPDALASAGLSGGDAGEVLGRIDL